MLPQGFKNSPTPSGNLLAKELEDWQGKHPSVTLLQYVNDILVGPLQKKNAKEPPLIC